MLFNNLTPSAKPFELTPTTTQRDLVYHVMKYRHDKLLETARPDIKMILHGESRPHASAWKTAPPKPEFMMDGFDFQLCVRRALRVPIFRDTIQCTCGSEITPFGDHTLSCKPGGGVVHRHDDGYRVITKLIRSSLMSCEVESTQVFPNGGTYRADIVIVQPIPGVTTRKALFDFTVTNGSAPYLADASAKAPEVAMKEGIKRKNKQIDVKSIKELGYDFVPLSFEAAGGFDNKTETVCLYLLSEKAKIHNRDLSEVVAEFWQELSVTMQRSNSHMIRARLSLQGAQYMQSRPSGV